MHTGMSVKYSILLLCLSLPMQAVGDQAQPATQPAEWTGSGLRTVLRDLRREHGVPALGVAVLRSDGDVAIEVVGVRKARSKHRARRGDSWHLGSCTKAMTATLCALLVDRGALRWDQTVGETFPELRDRLDEKLRTATLQQLVCHRAGLPSDFSPDYSIWPRIVALDGELPARRQGMIEIVMGRTPTSEPGSAYAYSNFGFAIAGAMAEKAAGLDYEGLMQRELFAPLGMTTAGFGPPDDDGRVSQPWGHRSAMLFYIPLEPGPDADNPAVLAPSGTGHMSLRDWSSFVRLHLRGLRGQHEMLKPETWRHIATDPYDQQYAFGWSRPAWTGVKGRALGHYGTNRLWHAFVALLPDEDLAILAVCNAGGSEAETAVTETVRRVHRTFFRQDAP